MRRAEQRIALVGALLGAFASAYLLVDYVFGSGICLTGSGCDVVRSSALAYPLGIPMPLLGLGFYLAAIVLLLMDPGRVVAGFRLRVLAVGWAVLGLAVMAVLTFVELFVIGAVCSWCMLSTVASVLLAGGAIATWRTRREAPVEEARSSRARRRQSASLEESRRDLQRFALRSGAVLGAALVMLIVLPTLTSGVPAGRADVAAADRPRLGDGAVDVVVFSDFQCPACAVVAPVLSRLADDGAVSVVYRYFPLVSIHANAGAAAAAAQAAALQGRFWEFHDALFARQASWAELPATNAAAAFASIAGQVGVDVARWRADAGSRAVTDVVTADRDEAEGLRLSGTPTIFIRGVRYDGPLNYPELLRAVEAAGPAG